MNKKILLFLLLGIQLSLAQVKTSEKPPVFEGCENLDAQKTEYCFYNKLQEFVFQNFEVPEVVDKEDYKANVIVLFQVDDQESLQYYTPMRLIKK